MHDADTDTAAVIADLQAQIDELRQQLTRAATTPAPAVAADVIEPTANRRSLLKLAGAAAVGTVASAAVASRAAAEIGYDGTQVVADAVNQRQSASLPGKTAFVFQTVGGQSENSSSFPGALGGWTYDSAAPNGIYGYSQVNNGRGVVGWVGGLSGTGVEGIAFGAGVGVLGTSDTGVRGEGTQLGVIGLTSTTNGVGVHGQSIASNAKGVVGTGIGADAVGVRAVGEGSNSAGVDAAGEFHGVRAVASGPASTGVDAIGSAHGVWGRSNGDFGVGVRASASGNGGVGVFGVGTQYGVVGGSSESSGVGGYFIGLSGALLVGSADTAPPPSRTRTYELGVIEPDAAGNVWYCYEAGTPGKWRKLSGGSTAGAFHPLAPGRVYDSREALPSPGALSGGQSRTISVADRRATSGGAVTLAGFVPAGATAVAANVTVVSVAGGGFLACNPGGITEVTASTINWSAPDQAIANGVILALNTNRELTVVAGGGTTHFLVDITGYWL